MSETEELIALATRAAENAYSPYSKLKVGAALRTRKGDVFTGCNVENASYGLGICAERTAIFKAVAEEGSQMRIAEIAAIITPDIAGSPCGACRQVIAEFSDSETTVTFLGPEGLLTLSVGELLPFAFQIPSSTNNS